MKCFGIIFGNIKFNTRGIKGKYLGKKGINLLTDRLRIVNHLPKHVFNMVSEPQFEGRG